MTALQLTRRRLAIRFGQLGWEAMLLGAVALAGVAALLLSYAASLRAEPTVASVTLPPTQAARLIAATSGEQSNQVQALGVEAQKINASLPFAGGPVQAARPFDPPSTGTAYERALTCLTQAVYYEAGYEPVAGRRAVAQVVLNRVRHPAFPKSVCGVVYQRNSTPVCQFSFVCDGSMNRAPAAASWRIAREVAAAALAGQVEPSVGSATHYHADYVAPRWAPLLAKIHKIGAHIFYRWPGAWGQVGAFTGRYIGEPSDPAAMRVIARPALLTERDANGEIVAINPDAVLTGPPVARAANDVGGLLDTSKGWTLNIPLPGETGGKAQAVASPQLGKLPAPAPAPATAAAVTVAASGAAVLASAGTAQ